MKFDFPLVYFFSFILRFTIIQGHQLYFTKRDRRYTGEASFKNVNVTSITECQVRCQSTSNCSATNYGPIDSAENGEHICEFFETQSYDNAAFEHTQGWFYIGKCYIIIFVHAHINYGYIIFQQFLLL